MWGRPDLALGPVLADPSGLVGLNATHVPATPRPVSSSDLPLELGLRHRVACSALVSPPQRPAAATHSLFELRVQILLLPLPPLTALAAPAGRQWGLSASPPQPALRRPPHSVSAAAGPVQATTIFCLDDHSRVLAGLPAIVSAGVAGGSLRSVSHTPWLPQGPLTLPGVHVVTEAVSGRAHRAEVCTRRRGVVLKRWFLSVAEVAVAAVLVLVGGVCPLLRSPREKLRFRLSYAVALRRVPVDTLCQPCPGRCPWGSQAAPGAAFE